MAIILLLIVSITAFVMLASIKMFIDNAKQRSASYRKVFGWDWGRRNDRERDELLREKIWLEMMMENVNQ